MMIAGRVFLISPPIEGSKATHQTSPRRGAAVSPWLIRDVSDQPLAPFQRFRFPPLVRRHRAVALLQTSMHDVRAGKIVQEAADVAPADNLSQTLVDLVFDCDGELFARLGPHIRILYVLAGSLNRRQSVDSARRTGLSACERALRSRGPARP